MRRVLGLAGLFLAVGAGAASAQSRGDLLTYDGFAGSYEVEVLAKNPDGTIRVRPKGSTYRTDESDVPASALHTKSAPPANAAAAPSSPGRLATQNAAVASCDWSAWGVFREGEF